jgi:quercetin dioxygenase-like cupin family protein
LAKVFDLNKLVAFSQKQGLLNSMEDRGRVKKDLLKTKNFNIVLICLETGQEIPSRPEPYSVCFYIIGGKGTFTVGTEQVELEGGDMVFIPAHEARGIKSKDRLTLLGIQDPH